MTDGTASVPKGGYRTIQALRAVACLLVVAYHALEAWGRMLAPGRRSIELWPNGSAGVDLFFVISGFVMLVSSGRLAGRAGGWRVFLARRLERIVPLYWLLTGIKAAIAYAAPGLTPTTRLLASNLVCSLLFIPSRDGGGMIRPVLPVGWTLNFEMLFYLVFAIGLALRLPPLRVLLPMLAPLAAFDVIGVPDHPAVLSFANGLVLELCFGVVLAGWPVLKPRAAMLSCVVGAGLLMALPALGPWRFLFWGLPATAVVAGAVGLERVCAARIPQIVLRLGDASYAIYLSHLFVIPALAHGMARLRLGQDAALAVLIAISLPICSAAGIVVYEVLDRPVQTWLRRRTVPSL